MTQIDIDSGRVTIRVTIPLDMIGADGAAMLMRRLPSRRWAPPRIIAGAEPVDALSDSSAAQGVRSWARSSA